MTVKAVQTLLNAEILAEGDLERPVSGGVVCDVMSQAMARGFRGMAWITAQANINALAVAVMTDAACLIFPAGFRPEEAVVRRACEERTTLLAAKESAFELAGRLYAAGLRGEAKNG